MTELTPKAERTRNLILNTALALFTEQGYEATTMRVIAQNAGVSLGLAYRYFESKEALVLALYQRMAAETDGYIAELADGSMAERFYAFMTYRLSQAEPYREAFGALFGAIMNPNSGIGLFSAGAGPSRQRAEDAFLMLIQGANDAPRSPQDIHLARLLNSLHFGVILFWLHDRSASQAATRELLVFLRDTMQRWRRVLTLPLVARELGRLAGILESVFGTK